MPTITVMDPVTRIEGHLKIEVTIDSVAGRQQVTDARATGTLFRGFEKILVGRAPSDLRPLDLPLPRRDGSGRGCWSSPARSGP